ncbi:MAG: hypothetical protein MK102_16455 [Fuerstiella sp.]|nr:hypothetical protein [Fuerstiella sp.]
MGAAALVRNTVILLLMQFLVGLPAGYAQPAAGLGRQHRNILEKRSTILENLWFELHQVRDRCREKGLTQAEADLTQLLQELNADAPESRASRMVSTPISSALPEIERQWRKQVLKLRQGRAKELYTLARKSLQTGLPSIAYMLIHDVLRLDPDHVNARAIFGQQRFVDPFYTDDDTYAGEWVSVWEAKMRGGRSPHIPDKRFGWIPRDHLKRYEDGMRPWKGSWHSKQKDELIRRDFSNAWEIESEHFHVRTNVSLEEGVLLSQRLEAFHEWLRQNFAAFFDTPADLRSRFANAHIRRRRRSRSGKPMEVWYYATEDEYRRMVHNKIPPEIQTNGLYWQPDSRCYFFKNTEHDRLDTLFHEATHQILDIPTRKARLTAARSLASKTGRQRQEWILGGRSGFWLIEGLACYFESFEVDDDGTVSVGRPDHIRIFAAQRRLLRDNFYVPLETFCRLGKDQFQQHRNVPQLYSQASGVAHFLMHYEDGRYRDDLVRLLDELYRPDARNPLKQANLSEITDVPFTNLDQLYRDHLNNLAQQVPGVVVAPIGGGSAAERQSSFGP